MLLVLFAVVAAGAQARLTGADLQGVVLDQTGGRLPGADVTATNLETNVPRPTTTDRKDATRFSMCRRATIA